MFQSNNTQTQQRCWNDMNTNTLKLAINTIQSYNTLHRAQSIDTRSKYFVLLFSILFFKQFLFYFFHFVFFFISLSRVKWVKIINSKYVIITQCLNENILWRKSIVCVLHTCPYDACLCACFVCVTVCVALLCFGI